MSNITTIEFISPRSVSAGELVMDPNTGRFGFARRHYDGGQLGEFSAGSGYLMTVQGTVMPGADLWCRGGVLGGSPLSAGDLPCARVVNVMSVQNGETTVVIEIL